MTEELYLEWGLEGGGDSLYRCTGANGTVIFTCKSSRMILDENDDEDWLQETTEFLSFEAYWSTYQDEWHLPHMRIQFCHPELKGFMLEQFKALLPKANRESTKRTIERTLLSLEEMA